MKVKDSIFREYDIRGITGTELSQDFAYQLGVAFSEWCYQKQSELTPITISVGRDCRVTSAGYSEWLIKGLNDAGVNIIDLGICPTPLTYFSTTHFKTLGAIMVTGSHNASEYNGFKLCFQNDTLHGEQIQELKQILKKNQFTIRDSGTIEFQEIIPAYLDYVSKQFQMNKKLKIVLDAGNGTASTVAPDLFKLLGAEVIPLYCDLDGQFPNHHPDPTIASNLTALIKTVKEEGADFGIGFDGDSDRIGAVNEKGEILYGDDLLLIFSRSILKQNSGATIISDVKSSNRLFQDIQKNGGVPLMWKSGHSLIKSKMKETGALLAGEMSGHIFFSDRWFGFDDAIYAAARLYEIVAQENKPLSELTLGLPESYFTPELRIPCEEALKFKLIHEAKKLIHHTGVVTELDGVRLDENDSWGLMRASNTQPAIVMRFEAVSPEKLSHIRLKFETAIQTAAQKIGHPRFEF